MYAAQWEDYRKRRAMFLIFLLGFPGPFVVMILLSQMFPDEIAHNKEIADRVYFVMGGVWWLGGIVTWIRLMYWRCPRCDNLYFARLVGNPFARECRHCGLKKWDEGEPEKDERFYSKEL